ncbi:MAG: hypothetical protein J5I90_00780 [Caldilineales bacterium]|nr:hypothetical protein [Caldilineales bacterium]
MNTVHELPAAIDVLQNRVSPESERVNACHVLGRSANPQAITALIAAMSDRMFAMRPARRSFCMGRLASSNSCMN